MDFIQNLKDKNGNIISGLEDSTKKVMDVIVALINYFKEGTYEPLRYENNYIIENTTKFIKEKNYKMKDIEVMEETINIIMIIG